MYLERKFIEVKTRPNKCKQKLIIDVVYRPLNVNITAFTNHVTNIMQVLKVVNKQSYINGDSNINLLNYDSLRRYNVCTYIYTYHQ